jgi:hypothetical protein
MDQLEDILADQQAKGNHFGDWGGQHWFLHPRVSLQTFA